MGRKPGTTGCKTCLKRRIKCDRGLPECFHCVRSGWKCDGYPPQVQFHAETFHVIESGSSSSPSSSPKSPKSPSHSRSSLSSKSAVPSLSESLSTLGPDLETLKLNAPGNKSGALRRLRPPACISQVQRTASLCPLPSIRPSLSPSQNVASKLSSEHLSPDIPMRLQLCFFGSYIRFIPSRMGHNRALDLAVSCLCQAHSMRLLPEPSPEAILRGNKTYGVALQALQLFITDPSLAFEPELLCTTELLATYEMIMNDDSTAYVRHIAGISKLIYYRWHARHKTPFELALLDSMRGPIIALALITRTACFLDEPGWRNIPCCHSGNIDEISVGRGKDRLSWLFCKLPGLLRDLENYLNCSRTRWRSSRENQDAAREPAAKRDELLSRMLRQYDDLNDLERYYKTVLATLPDDRNETLERTGKAPLLVVETDLPRQTTRYLEDHRASIQILIILAIGKLLGHPGNLVTPPNFFLALTLECNRLRDYLLQSNLEDDGPVAEVHQHGPDFMRMGQNFTLRIAYAVVPREDKATREKVRRKIEVILARPWTTEEMDWLNKMTFGMCL